MGDGRDQLRLIGIFHWVLAGLTLLFAFFPLLYVGLGVFFLRGPHAGPNPPPPIVGWFMIAIGVAFVLGILGYAALVAVAGHFVSGQRNWTFVLVVAALSCAFFPFGTALGVFTIVVISRPEVKALFEGQARAP